MSAVLWEGHQVKKSGKSVPCSHIHNLPLVLNVCQRIRHSVSGAASNNCAMFHCDWLGELWPGECSDKFHLKNLGELLVVVHKDHVEPSQHDLTHSEVSSMLRVEGLAHTLTIWLLWHQLLENCPLSYIFSPYEEPLSGELYKYCDWDSTQEPAWVFNFALLPLCLWSPLVGVSISVYTVYSVLKGQWYGNISLTNVYSLVPIIRGRPVTSFVAIFLELCPRHDTRSEIVRIRSCRIK